MMLDLGEIFSKYNIKPQGVLHVGASEGQERDFYKGLGVQRVYWIEGLPHVYFILKQNLHAYHNQYPILACVSNESGKRVTFNISSNKSQSSSILELGEHLVAHPEVSYIDKVEVETWRIDWLFEVMGLDTSMLDFLNMDLQGAELLALEGMGKMIDQFKYINIEVNKRETYKGCALIEDIDYFMIKHGFDRVETGQWVADLWTDAFYMKPCD